MAKIGYARVSTDDQTTALQLDALEAEGCARIFQDVASGARSNRKGLAEAIAACAAGDVLTVWKLDRLGRKLVDLLNLAETLKARSVGLKFLSGAGSAIDTTTPEGRFMYGALGLFAEFERELNRERTTAGIKAARRRGKHLGRPRKLTADHLDVAAQLLDSGRSWREVARPLGVAPSTLRAGLERRTVEMLQRRQARSSPKPDGAQIDPETHLATVKGVGGV